MAPGTKVNPGLNVKPKSGLNRAILALRLLVRMRPLTLALFVCGPLISQQAEFDVASIRPAGNAIAKPAMEFTPGGGVRATNVTLKMLIQMAYDIRDDQISGGPGWTDSETYTVVAKGSGGGTAASKTALQALLRERFHLELKRATNAAAGYVMAVGKSEPKITLDTGRERPLMRQTGRWSLHCERVAMSSLATFLSVHLGRSVEDRTGLEGRYNFELNWRPADLSDIKFDGSRSPAEEESLVLAVREQLGLKLEPEKGVGARYRIEMAEKPGEN